MLAHELVCTSQALQHCRNSSTNSCSHTCGTEEEPSPLILALALGMKIGLICKPGGCLCQRLKSSRASALCLHTVNFRVSLGLLHSLWEPKVNKNRTRKDMPRMSWIRCSPHQTVKWQLRSNTVTNAGSGSLHALSPSAVLVCAQTWTSPHLSCQSYTLRWPVW